MVATSTLASLAKAALSNSKDVAVLLDAASVVVTAASALLKEAKPVLDEINTEEVLAKIQAGAKAAANEVGKTGNAVMNTAGGAAGAIGGMFARLGDAKDGILSDLATAKSEKELRKAIKEARQSVLENATTSISVSDLLKAASKSKESGIGPISDLPGCFVIATYKKLDFNSDLTDYIGIFVGKAANASDGVFTAISREGNPDVYADVKYKQNVRIYVYKCLAESLDERYFSLYQTFSGNELYTTAISQA